MAERRKRGERQQRPDLLIRAALVFTAAVVPVILIRPAISEYEAQGLTEEGVLLASRITPEDAQYPSALGLLSQLSPDKAKASPAKERYLSALAKNPTEAFVWLVLAKTLREEGQVREADYAFRKALATDRANPALVLEAALYALNSGHTAEAVPLLRRYIGMLPSEQER
ncbi:MAG: hypothetical protein HGA78_02895, partial [Nitrospirales bacterium]|nr:hypothetical protein [Nitrospirales bacterium]